MVVGVIGELVIFWKGGELIQGPSMKVELMKIQKLTAERQSQ